MQGSLRPIRLRAPPQTSSPPSPSCHAPPLFPSFTIPPLLQPPRHQCRTSYRPPSPPTPPLCVAYPPSPNYATLTNPRLGPSRPPPAISSSLLRAIAQRYHGTGPERTPLHNLPLFVPALVGSMQWRTSLLLPARLKVRPSISAAAFISLVCARLNMDCRIRGHGRSGHSDQHIRPAEREGRAQLLAPWTHG